MSYSLTSVGDIIMAGPYIGAGEARDKTYGVLRDADHCFINLEMPLTLSTQETDKTICLKAPPSLAAEMRALGVDIATFANNHAMDYGAAGLADTLFDPFDTVLSAIITFWS